MCVFPVLCTTEAIFPPVCSFDSFVKITWLNDWSFFCIICSIDLYEPVLCCFKKSLYIYTITWGPELWSLLLRSCCPWFLLLCLFWFHIYFKIVFSSSLRNAVGSWIGIVLNLCISFGCMGILTILALLIGTEDIFPLFIFSERILLHSS